MYNEADAPIKPPPGEQWTYRPDLYYINQDLGHGSRREQVVPAWRFYLTWLLTFFKVERRWKRSKGFHVLRENGDW